jgi:hypothetical protein
LGLLLIYDGRGGVEIVSYVLVGGLGVFCHAWYFYTFVLRGVIVGAFMYGVSIYKFVVICCIFYARFIVWDRSGFVMYA